MRGVPSLKDFANEALVSDLTENHKMTSNDLKDHAEQLEAQRTSLGIAVLTISDSRRLETDDSGQALIRALESDGHRLAARALVRDDVHHIRAQVCNWVIDASVQVIVTTGGTGFTGRDSTPEALAPLFDKTIHGFGELFRQVSYEEIGPSTVQSRALGGLIGSTLVFALPGSPNAVKTGWDKLLHHQLDSTSRPCNFADLIARFGE